MEEMIAAAIKSEDKELLIDEIMKWYGQEILQLAYSYVRNQAIAEDLTQDIFVKCYRSIDTYNGKSKLRTWLWRIAINHCKDFLKSWHNKNVVPTDEEMAIGSEKELVEGAVIQKEADDQLIEAILTLPVMYREVIYFFYYEERTIKEISELTDVRSNTVKTRLRRAKELLKERLEES